MHREATTQNEHQETCKKINGAPEKGTVAKQQQSVHTRSKNSPEMLSILHAAYRKTIRSEQRQRSRRTYQKETRTQPILHNAQDWVWDQTTANDCAHQVQDLNICTHSPPFHPKNLHQHPVLQEWDKNEARVRWEGRSTHQKSVTTHGGPKSTHVPTTQICPQNPKKIDWNMSRDMPRTLGNCQPKGYQVTTPTSAEYPECSRRSLQTTCQEPGHLLTLPSRPMHTHTKCAAPPVAVGGGCARTGWRRAPAVTSIFSSQLYCLFVFVHDFWVLTCCSGGFLCIYAFLHMLSSVLDDYIDM